MSVSAVFEPRSGETWRDPFPMYAALRDHDPVHHHAETDTYVLTRFVDVWNAARDTATFSSAQGLTMGYDDMSELGIGDATPMVFLDPPEHTEFRRLVAKGLTPRQVSLMEDDIRAFVVERIEKLRATGGGDIVAELFKPLPSFVVAHYLGVPAEDRPLFDRWTEQIVQAAAQGETGEVEGDPFGELVAYFSDLIERRRRHPGDDLVSDLVQMGEDTVSALRIIGFAFTMVTGGNDTVTGLLGGSAVLLHDHRDQRQKLLDDPTRIDNALEELLRLTSPAQNLARTTTAEVELHDAIIPSGKKVLLCYAAGNRDHREFGPTAEVFDVDRRMTKILTFSYGAHHCIGAAVARLQGRVVIAELLNRCPDFSVDEAGGAYAGGNYVRRLASLPFEAG